jgi:hypothetical protein
MTNEKERLRKMNLELQEELGQVRSYKSYCLNLFIERSP